MGLFSRKSALVENNMLLLMEQSSILPVVSLFSNIVAKQMSRTQQFANAQWGFQIEKSTVTALTATTHDQFQMLDSGNDLCAVFLDIATKADSSACNHAKVWHSGLNNYILH